MEVTVGSWVKHGPAHQGPVLAIDTSTERAAIAIGRADGSFLVAPAGSSRQHGRGLVPALRDLLRAARVRPSDLVAIGVGLGPGSFTGLRIGVTAAKTLAYALGCPLFGIDSLEAIARNAPADALVVLAVGDAQRGDLFHAFFQREGRGLPLVRQDVNGLTPGSDLARSISAGTMVLGPPLGRVEPTWPESVTRLESYPEGAILLDLTRERISSGTRDDPWFLEPRYARRSAAEEKAPPQASASRPSPCVKERQVDSGPDRAHVPLRSSPPGGTPA